MTNEEKAKEISSSLWSGDNMNGSIIRGTATMAALKMAEWKEQQMIDKAVEWLALNAQLYGGFNPGCLEDMVTKFKQSMKEE